MSAGRILAIDQGTTATKALVLDPDGTVWTGPGRRHEQIYPQAGWVEHDPEALLASLRACLADAEAVTAVGLANQGETVVAWDAQTGAAVCNAIVWQDRRTADTVARLKADGVEAETLTRAGLPLDPYFSATKLRWILDHVPEARALRARGRLRMGTSDAFFLDRLCGSFATDVTTASRTSLMNLDARAWDPVLCEAFGVPPEVLPQIRPTTGPFGEVATPGATVPLTASVVDQQAALYGHGCRAAGDVKITFGTGAFVLAVAGPTRLGNPDSGILPTIAWQLGDAAPVYALDGGVFNAASAVDWARRLGLFADYDEIDAFEGGPAIDRDLVFVPALSGLACPYWDGRAAGLWLGMSLDTTQADLCQAVLEGVALRSAQVVEAMAGLLPLGDTISIDGGLSANRYFRRFLATATGRRVVTRGHPELTALGTAQLAGAGAGMTLPEPSDAEGAAATCDEPESHDGTAHRTRFAEAIERARGWRRP